MNVNQKKWAIWISIAAVVVLAASFMPWGEIQATPSVSLTGQGSDFFGSNPFGGMTVTLTINGWNGSVTLAGIQIPNWTMVLLAAAVAALAWLGASGAWQSPRFLSPALAVLGLLQAVLTLVILASSGKSSIGVGIIVTVAGFAAMAFASFTSARQGPASAG